MADNEAVGKLPHMDASRKFSPGGLPSRRSTAMTAEAKTKALLDLIEHRLTAISEQQHALAVGDPSPGANHAVAARHLTPDTAVANLKGPGVTLRGLSAAWAAARRSRRPLRKAVTFIPPAGSSCPLIRLLRASRPLSVWPACRMKRVSVGWRATPSMTHSCPAKTRTAYGPGGGRVTLPCVRAGHSP